MKILCVYHKADLDGMMSAAIVVDYLENNKTTTHFIEHKSELKKVYDKFTDYDEDITHVYMFGWDGNLGVDMLPNLYKYDYIYLVDLSFPFDLTNELVQHYGEKFIWIDHHISAIKKLDVIQFKLPNTTVPLKINGLRDEEYSACELTWQFFYDKSTTPKIVTYLGEFDTFRFKKSNSKLNQLNTVFFQYGAQYFIRNYQSARNYLDKYKINSRIPQEAQTSKIREIGSTIYYYNHEEVKKALKTYAFPINFEINNVKYNFLAINAFNFNPSAFDLDDEYKDYDGLMSFTYFKGVWKISFSSSKIDVSVIATHFGGGGHVGRAGCTLNNFELGRLINS
jgi:oligoribonuclease NrnB/cAMP/cGMP phosphodiesterase (DHH superfamily)